MVDAARLPATIRVSRVLLGDALVSERERLHDRMQQFFERIDLQLRQILRGADASGRFTRCARRRKAAAALLTAFVEGSDAAVLRSRFSQPSLSAWEVDWRCSATACSTRADAWLPVADRGQAISFTSAWRYGLLAYRRHLGPWQCSWPR